MQHILSKLLVVVVYLFFTQLALAEEQSILDLYLEIPATLLRFQSQDNLQNIDETNRKERVVINDSKNGYLKINPTGLDSYDSDIYLAKFIKADQSVVVALSADLGDRTEHISFFTKTVAGWKDVTKEVMPIISYRYSDRIAATRLVYGDKTQRKLSDCASGTYRFSLPRIGTTIRAVASSDCVTKGNGETLFKLYFDPSANGVLFKLEPEPN